MEKRYQVFISSTFADLQDERAKVQQTIMEMDCIPAGMEAFPAIDEEQFEFIKKVIDDCDYYVLIIGGRYGSLSDAGVSYTEMEYEYAISKGIKVMAFLHNDPDSLPVNKTEKVTGSKKKLAAFREKAATGRLVKFWNTANELPGLVALSLSKTIKTHPAIGWVRANTAQDPNVYKELSDLRKENQKLKEAFSSSKKGEEQNFAGLEDNVTLHGWVRKNTGSDKAKWNDWEATLTWGDILSILGLYLMESRRSSDVESKLADVLYRMSSDNPMEPYSYTSKILEEDFEAVTIQLKVLGLISLQHNTFDGIKWSLTANGEKKMLSLRAIKKTSE